MDKVNEYKELSIINKMKYRKTMRLHGVSVDLYKINEDVQECGNFRGIK